MIWILGKTVLCLYLLALIRLEYMLLPIENEAFQYIQLSNLARSTTVIKFSSFDPRAEIIYCHTML